MIAYVQTTVRPVVKGSAQTIAPKAAQSHAKEHVQGGVQMAAVEDVKVAVPVTVSLDAEATVNET